MDKKDNEKKESLYMVPIFTDEDGDTKILVEYNGLFDIIWDCENEGQYHELFTEKQIKAVNEKLWAFAVPYGVGA